MKKLIALILAGVFFAGSALAFDGGSGRFGGGGGGAVDLRFDNQGQLSGDGSSVSFQISTRCSQNANVSESFVSILQQNARGAAPLGQINCNNNWNQQTVTVSSAQGAKFTSGSAQVVGFLLACNSDFSQCQAVSPTQRIDLR